MLKEELEKVRRTQIEVVFKLCTHASSGMLEPFSQASLTDEPAKKLAHTRA